MSRICTLTRITNLTHTLEFSSIHSKSHTTCAHFKCWRSEKRLQDIADFALGNNDGRNCVRRAQTRCKKSNNSYEKFSVPWTFLYTQYPTPENGAFIFFHFPPLRLYVLIFLLLLLYKLNNDRNICSGETSCKVHKINGKTPRRELNLFYHPSTVVVSFACLRILTSM